MRDGTTTAASLAALLLAGLTTGVSVAATGSGLGVRTESAATVMAPGGSAPGARAAGPSAPAARYVTRLTGVRGAPDARGRVTGVRQAPGGEHVPVSVRGADGDQHVVPAAAARSR
ncbi:hypothetical protein ABZ646_08865 [Streptomyces sp. NPDC007162]|uniref:hypothetical protein n=1 Tax=Streptomyces sp. NPDC007162 TaxID=3156917 RepID=UPI0034051EA5